MRCRYIHCGQKFKRPDRLPYTKYCEKHRCAKRDCSEFSFKRYCDEHRCRIRRCGQKAEHRSNYCEVHSCGAIDCNDQAWKDGFCQHHHCRVRGCRRSSTSSFGGDSGLCNEHRCRNRPSSPTQEQRIVNHNNCTDRRLGKCPIYHCTVRDCYNPVTTQYIPGNDPGQGYCSIHFCQQCKTPFDICNHEYPVDRSLTGWVYGCTHLTSDGKVCGQRRAWVKRYTISNGIRDIHSMYDEYCRECLKYCEIESCMNPHVKGTPRCLKHACECFGGHMKRRYCDHTKDTFRMTRWTCQSDRCESCPVTPKFIATYLMVGLGCDSPIIEAVNVALPGMSWLSGLVKLYQT